MKHGDLVCVVREGLRNAGRGGIGGWKELKSVCTGFEHELFHSALRE